ncbi:toprim domain-containing protein, partial [Candidatus Pelagibacter sp.]|nr:toprim domain-containing protein [Candidatus Pelagibacter sp.]
MSTRNLDINTIKKFQLGYLDYNTTLYKEFEIEFGEKILKDTGLFYYDEKKKIFVDRFRNRLIFPINNISNNPIAIGGRIIENKDYLAKYINSPETPFFKKGSNLYNLNLARSRSNSSEFVYVVEGYMDVIGMCKNEIENVVANLGTALTEKQILTLNQFFNHIVICFDSDKSGYAAALRAAENSIINLVPDKKISFLFLPEGEDPDTFVNKYGKNKFDEFTKLNLISIHEFIFEKYRSETDNNPSSLAIFEKK